MKKKKKIFVFSDGRIFFNSVLPFFQKNSILISLIDSFLITNRELLKNKTLISNSSINKK